MPAKLHCFDWNWTLRCEASPNGISVSKGRLYSTLPVTSLPWRPAAQREAAADGPGLRLLSDGISVTLRQFHDRLKTSRSLYAWMSGRSGMFSCAYSSLSCDTSDCRAKSPVSPITDPMHSSISVVRELPVPSHGPSMPGSWQMFTVFRFKSNYFF